MHLLQSSNRVALSFCNRLPMAPSNPFHRIADLPPEQAIEQLLGITAADLKATALQCFRSASLAGPLQPKGSDGTLAWIFGTEAFRQQMLPKVETC